MLDDELNNMGPIARDLDTLHRQLDEVQGFIDKVAGCKDELAQASRAADDLVSKGFIPNAREVKDNIAAMSKQVDKLAQRGKAREKDVDTMIGKVTAFYDLYTGVMSDIQNVLQEEKSLGSIAGD